MSCCLKSFLEHCGWEIKNSLFFSVCGELERVPFWEAADAAPGAGAGEVAKGTGEGRTGARANRC